MALIDPRQLFHFHSPFPFFFTSTVELDTEKNHKLKKGMEIATLVRHRSIDGVERHPPRPSHVSSLIFP